ncbi:hypothetical protein [Amycolatopsis sp. CA-230715]|uniref:hypothetical protein n=1 Tax=Amycolatopsis sp. CA-230715 TaxID=2745196 RepID=UPI001C01C7F6|nr:hypothetical protein [Amycolatopsis sp. CA-230715]QWF79276.1 hypothetical protein HUW46_02683 [Amycolatopsis sp. CA-230715]
MTHTPTPPVTRGRRRWPWLAGALVVAAAVAVAAVVILSDEPTSSRSGKITGSMKINCVSSCTGYGDIRDGAQVILYNEKNEVLAITQLALGTVTTESTGERSYSFTFTHAPRGHKQYGVHVGNDNRGVIWKSESEAFDGGFAISIG